MWTVSIDSRNPRRVRWRDAWGSCHSLLFPSPEAAVSFAQLKITEIAADFSRRKLLPSRLSVHEALDLYYFSHPFRSDQGRRAHRAWLATFEKHFGGSDVRNLRPLDLDRHFLGRLRTLCPTTYYQEVAEVRRVFRWLLASSLISLSPVEHLHAPSAHSQRHRCLSWLEEFQALQALPLAHLSKLILLLDQGFRAQEMLRLTRSNLDFAQQTTTWIVSKSLVPLTLPWTGRLSESLSAYQNLSSYQRLFNLSPKTHGLHWLGPVRATGLHFDTLDLRHTFATRLEEASHDPLLVNYCLGHSLASHASTLYMAHFSLERLRVHFREMEEVRIQAFRNLRKPEEIPDAEIWRELEGR